jgi:hypothetical protein
VAQGVDKGNVSTITQGPGGEGAHHDRADAWGQGRSGGSHARGS